MPENVPTLLAIGSAACLLLVAVCFTYLFCHKRKAKELRKKDEDLQFFKQSAANLTKQLKEVRAIKSTAPVTVSNAADPAVQQRLAEYEQLSLNYSQLHHAYTAMRATCVDRSELSSCTQALAAKEREYGTLSARQANLVRELDALRLRQSEENAGLRKAEEEIAELKNQLASSREQFPVLGLAGSAPVVDHTAQLDEIRAELQASRAEVASVLAERDAGQTELASLRVELAAAQEQVQSFRTEPVAALPLALGAEASAQGRVDELEREIAAMKTERERWLDELAATPLVSEEELKRIVESHEVTTMELRADVEAAEAARDEIKHRLEELQEHYIEPHDMDRLEHQLKALTEEHARLMDDFSAVEETVKFQAQVAEERDRLIEDLGEARDRLSDLAHDSEEMKAELLSLDAQLGEKDTALGTATEQLEELRAQLSRSLQEGCSVDQHLLALKNSQLEIITLRNLAEEATAAQQSRDAELEKLSAALAASSSSYQLVVTERDQLLAQLASHELTKSEVETAWQNKLQLAIQGSSVGSGELNQLRQAKDELRELLEQQMSKETALRMELDEALSTMASQREVHGRLVKQAEDLQAASEDSQATTIAELELLRSLVAEQQEQLLTHQQEHQQLLTAKDEHVAQELDQIRLALMSAQDSAQLASQRLNGQWLDLSSDLEATRDELKIAKAESMELRAALLEHQERLALAESVSLRAQAEVSALQLNRVAPAANLRRDNDEAPPFASRGKLVGVYQASSMVFVYEEQKLTGSRLHKAVMMMDEQDQRSAATSLLGEGMKLLQPSLTSGATTEPGSDLTPDGLNQALLRALNQAEDQVAKRAETRRLYRKAFAKFHQCNGSLPGPECSVAADAAMALSQMLLEDLDSASSLEVARAAADWAQRGHGPSSIATAETQSWLAKLLIQQGQVDDGIAAYRQTLSIRESTLGFSHPDTLAARTVIEAITSPLAFSA
jgi:hypothetical protein